MLRDVALYRQYSCLLHVAVKPWLPVMLYWASLQSWRKQKYVSVIMPLLSMISDNCINSMVLCRPFAWVMSFSHWIVNDILILTSFGSYGPNICYINPSFMSFHILTAMLISVFWVWYHVVDTGILQQVAAAVFSVEGTLNLVTAEFSKTLLSTCWTK